MRFPAASLLALQPGGRKMVEVPSSISSGPSAWSTSWRWRQGQSSQRPRSNSRMVSGSCAVGRLDARHGGRRHRDADAQRDDLTKPAVAFVELENLAMGFLEGGLQLGFRQIRDSPEIDSHRDLEGLADVAHIEAGGIDRAAGDAVLRQVAGSSFLQLD